MEVFARETSRKHQWMGNGDEVGLKMLILWAFYKICWRKLRLVWNCRFVFWGLFFFNFRRLGRLSVMCGTETGYIIPAVFGRWRKSNKLGYNPFRDIRRNIFKHYDAQNVIRRPELVTSSSGIAIPNSLLTFRLYMNSRLFQWTHFTGTALSKFPLFSAYKQQTWQDFCAKNSTVINAHRVFDEMSNIMSDIVVKIHSRSSATLLFSRSLWIFWDISGVLWGLWTVWSVTYRSMWRFSSANSSR